MSVARELALNARVIASRKRTSNNSGWPMLCNKGILMKYSKISMWRAVELFNRGFTVEMKRVYLDHNGTPEEHGQWKRMDQKPSKWPNTRTHFRISDEDLVSHHFPKLNAEIQMSAFKLSSRSIMKMVGVHPDLVRVVNEAIKITPIDFGITCGTRTLAQQRVLVATGKSQTMNSRHLTGHAVDVVAMIDGKASWEMKDYKTIALAFKRAAKSIGIPIKWGGEWSGFPDGPHFELDRAKYP